MDLQLITSGIAFLGMLSTAYCVFWLSTSLRTVVRQEV
jgi:hypothetical protein